jgi:hypothetical protein
MYRVWTSNNSYIDVTEDHSLMHFVNGVVSEVKPFEDIGKLICFNGTDTVIDTLIFDSKDTAMIQVFDMLNKGQYATVTSIGDMFMVNSANIKSESIGKGFNISDVYKIEKISYDGYVYDIEVDDTHVFYANNILVHNTDSVTGDTKVWIDGNNDTIENWFVKLSDTHEINHMPDNVELLALNGSHNSPCVYQDGDLYKVCDKDVNLIYRHKTRKKLYRLTTSTGKQITVTADHSLMILDDNGNLVVKKPTELNVNDKVLEMDN